MEIQYKTANGRLVFKVTGETPKALFKEIAAIQDLFEAETVCGCCNSTNSDGDAFDIKFQLRTAGDRNEYEYYELVCKNPECRARFSFGQSKDQKSLFPKRKDDNGYFPNRGWARYSNSTRGGQADHIEDEIPF